MFASVRVYPAASITVQQQTFGISFYIINRNCAESTFSVVIVIAHLNFLVLLHTTVHNTFPILESARRCVLPIDSVHVTEMSKSERVLLQQQLSQISTVLDILGKGFIPQSPPPRGGLRVHRAPPCPQPRFQRKQVGFPHDDDAAVGSSTG